MNKILALFDRHPIKSSLFLGLFFSLAFYPTSFISFPQGLLFPFSILFLYVLRRIDKSRSYKEAFLVGFAFYIGHNLTLIPWFLNVSKYVSLLLVPGYVLAVLAVALFYGIAAVVTKKIGIRYAPFVFVFAEYMRQFGVFKFPWEFAGYMFGFNNYFIQSLDLFGIFGLSLLFYVFMLLIYSGVKYKNKFFYNIAAVLFILNFIYGYATYEKKESTLAEMNVGVLQSNISQGIKWKPKFKDSTYLIYNSLTDSVMSDSTDLIVWAETAATGWIQKNGIDRRKVKEIVRKTGTYNYLGSLRYKKDSAEKIGYKYYNSMFLFDSLGKEVDNYDKSVLVQFGEYVPFGDLFPFLKNLDFGQSNFSAGVKRNLVQVKDASISTFICFEILFPNYVRKQVAKGGNLIITTSNDAWFEFLEPEQHFEMARFRAVENRRYLVRSGNIGISAIVTESGKVIKSIDVKKRDAILGKVKLFGERSFYNKYGDWIVYFSIFIVVLRFFVVFKARKYNQLEAIKQ